MRSLFGKRARGTPSLARCSVRPMLECLEERNLLSGSDVTFTFTVPANGGYPGQDIYLYMAGLESGSQPVYLNSSNQWETSTAGQNVPYFAEIPTSTGTGSTPVTVSIPSGASFTGRLVMSVGPLAIPGGQNPSFTPKDYPNTVYDFFEVTYTPNAASGIDSINTDPSQVDQVGLTYTVESTGYSSPTSPAPTSYTRGSTIPDTDIQGDFSNYTANTPFHNLLNPPTSNVPRIVSPKMYLDKYALPSDPLNGYFNPALESFFSHYTAPNSFVLDYSGTGVFTGNVTTITGGYKVLQLTNPNYTGDFDIYEPVFPGGNTSYPAWMPNQSESSGRMVFGQDGVFNTLPVDPNQPTANNNNVPSGGTALSQIEAFIGTAFVRGIATNYSLPPSDWVIPYGMQTTNTLTATAGTGGSLTPGTYYYVINGVNSAGTTVASNEISVPVGPGQSSVLLNWTPSSDPANQSALDPLLGVIKYNIYRSTSPGQEKYIGSVLNPGASSYPDTGAPSQPISPSFVYYQSGSTYSYYAAFLHQPNIMANGYAYGFPDDDRGSQSTDVTVFSNPTNTFPMTEAITLAPWSSPSPSTPPSSTPSSSNGSSSAMADFLFLAEDQFAWTVDSMMSLVSNNPLLTHAADQMMILLNDFLHLDNSALRTDLDSLQSAIKANPLYGALEGLFAQVVGYDWAANLFAPPNQS